MNDSSLPDRREGRRLWGVLNIALPFLVGNGFLVTLALYERDANFTFKLWIAFGVIWNLVATIRAFQVGRVWDRSGSSTGPSEIH